MMTNTLKKEPLSFMKILATSTRFYLYRRQVNGGNMRIPAKLILPVSYVLFEYGRISRRIQII